MANEVIDMPGSPDAGLRKVALFDYLLHIVVSDLEHFSRFLLDKLLNASGVADVNSSFVLRTVKQTRELPIAVA